MKKVRAEDLIYRYSKNHAATREQLIEALECCSNPVKSCTGCVYHKMNVRGCIERLMEDVMHELMKDN